MLERKKLMDDQFREMAMQRIKNRDEHMEAEKKRLEAERQKELRKEAQFRWSVLVILASKREIISDQVGLLRSIYENNKRRFVAAVTIQRAWAKYREKLYQAGKLDSVKHRLTRLPLDLAIL